MEFGIEIALAEENYVEVNVIMFIQAISGTALCCERGAELKKLAHYLLI